MWEDINALKSEPKSVQHAIWPMCAGWALLYGFLFLFFTSRSTEIPSKLMFSLIVLGLGSCYIMIKLKPWGRWLCIMGNLIVICYHALPLMGAIQGSLVFSPIELALMLAINVLFAYSTINLFRKQTAAVFKARLKAQRVAEGIDDSDT